MKEKKIEIDSCAQMLSSLGPGAQDAPFQTNGGILEETQRLIEEAELKLRSMEGGIHQKDAVSKPDIFSALNDHHFHNIDAKNQKLKQALSNKMKKLEIQMETQSRRQVPKSDSGMTSSDRYGTAPAGHLELLSSDQRSERVHHGRVKRPCRKLAEPDHDSQDVIDVVRTARNSVQGALVAARRLSASLANRTPRTSKNSVSGMSVRPDPQFPECDSARSCAEHGAKRKVCSCLYPDYEGLKRGESKREIREGRETASSTGARRAPSKSNIGIFEAKCTTTVKEEVRVLPKRLQMSVMPSISIKRSLEKQVMPVIEVPFPGSTPEAPRRENTGVRNFRHIEPYRYSVVRQSAPKEPTEKETVVGSPQFDQGGPSADSRSVSDLDVSPRAATGGVVENTTECGTAINQLSRHLTAVEELREINQSQVNEVLKFLIEKIASSGKEAPVTTPRRPRSHDSKAERPKSAKADKVAESVSSSTRSLLQTDHSGSGDDAGSISYNSLSRFLETYYKAAVSTKRAKQKAAIRRKEEIRSMKEQEEKFKAQAKTSASESQRAEAVHNLIGPFRRAVKNGNRRDDNTRELLSTNNEDTPDTVPDVMAVHNSTIASAVKQRPQIDHDLTPNVRPNQLDELSVPPANPTFSKSSHDENPSETEETEMKEDVELSPRPSESNYDALSPRITADPPAHTESSDDNYEDDWEEDNEEDKKNEESVETRDVGDGSERENNDEPNEGLAHSLRTILEVEETSSHSVSLIHHEAPSQAAQSGANRSETSQFSYSKSSFPDVDEVKTPMPSQTDGRPTRIDGGFSELIPPREISCGAEPAVFDHINPLLQPVQPDPPIRKDVLQGTQTSPTLSAGNKTDNKGSEDFSSNRAFLEMTEALKKMLETVVSNLVQNKAHDEKPAPETSAGEYHNNAPPFPSSSYGFQRPSSKRLSVRFSNGPPQHDTFHDRRFNLRRYDPASSGSANDDRVSSGSEASQKGSYSHYRNLRWGHAEVNRRASSNRVRFKMGSKRSSATQTEEGIHPDWTADRGVTEELKCDAETQVTPAKSGEDAERHSWGRPVSDEFFLQQSKLSLSRTSSRLPPRPLAVSFDMDPTERLLAFGRSTRVARLNSAGILPEPVDRDREQTQCDSLSSSTSSLLPLDVASQPMNNTMMSLSEGEVLAYHSCSCSEGELCACTGNAANGRRCPYASSTGRLATDPRFPNFAETFSEPRFHREPNVQSRTPWSTVGSAMNEDDVDLSGHFSEGEIIEKLVGISNLLSGKTRESGDYVDHHEVLPNEGYQINFDLGQQSAPAVLNDLDRSFSSRVNFGGKIADGKL